MRVREMKGAGVGAGDVGDRGGRWKGALLEFLRPLVKAPSRFSPLLIKKKKGKWG